VSQAAPQHVLVVDDEPDLLELLELTLSRMGLDVERASTVGEAIAQLDRDSFDLCLTDMRLPDGTGLDLLRRMDEQGRSEKGIVITAYGSAENAVEALKAGAYDYLTKPFVFAELVARLRVLGRRLTRGDRSTSGDLRLDPVRHVLTCGDRETELTPTEFRLTGAMIARSGEVIRRREMIAAAWPPGAIVHDNTVDVYVRRLRRKLDELESESRIHTVHGGGYRLE